MCFFCLLENCHDITFIFFLSIVHQFYAKFVFFFLIKKLNLRLDLRAGRSEKTSYINKYLFDFDLLSRIYQYFEFIDNLLQFKNSSA